MNYVAVWNPGDCLVQASFQKPAQDSRGPVTKTGASDGQQHCKVSHHNCGNWFNSPSWGKAWSRPSQQRRATWDANKQGTVVHSSIRMCTCVCSSCRAGNPSTAWQHRVGVSRGREAWPHHNTHVVLKARRMKPLQQHHPAGSLHHPAGSVFAEVHCVHCVPVCWAPCTCKGTVGRLTGNLKQCAAHSLVPQLCRRG